MKNVNYSEGTIFLVPLRSGGFSRGLVSRKGKSGIIFGHFWGPKIFEFDVNLTEDLVPSNSILQIRFGDLGLIKNKWPIVGQLKTWQPSAWPMPVLYRVDPFEQASSIRVIYDDNDPSVILSEEAMENDNVNKDRLDVLYGYGAVEIKLTKMIG